MIVVGRGFSGGDSIKDSDARSFIKAASITDDMQKAAILILVNALRRNNLWGKMAAIYPLVGGNAKSHLHNLKDTTKHPISFGGAESHSTFGIIPNTSMPDFNINALDAANGGNTFHVSMYARNNVLFGDYYYDWGKYPAGLPATGGVIKYTSGYIYFDLSGARAYYNNPTATRLMVFNYLSGMSVFRDGTKLGSNATSVSIPHAQLRMNPYGMNLTREFSFISFGQGLTDAEITTLSNIVNEFQTALGRNV